MTARPTHGWTKHGHAVHARTVDHHPAETGYQRFNKKVAIALTEKVGTMTTFWIFCCLSLLSLPAVLSGFNAFKHTFPDWLIRASIIALVAWVAQTFIQLVLLPALMVGQNLQNAAADARTTKMFEDIEYAKNQLDETTEGGVRAVLDAITAVDAKVTPAPKKPAAKKAARPKAKKA
jgi:hypothetical protein